MQALAFGLAAALAAAPAFAGVEMSDAELDHVRAGAVHAAADGAGGLDFSFATGGARAIDGSGNLRLGSFSNTGTVWLQDGAQSQLRSVVNVNAANSLVQVLLNLNVNINSTVGSLVQSNLAARR
jgi:hypothetical protein